MPLHLARLELNKIALETKAVLEVSPKGDVVYKFFPDLDSIYRLHGINKIVQETMLAAYHAGFYILRISFGILLVASFVTIAVVFTVALIIILCGVDAADGDADLDLSDALDFDFFDFEALGMFFGWGLLSGGGDALPESYMGIKLDQPDRGFFSNCFSFLFGDGDPNKDIEETQWTYIAELIRDNGGAVVAEQLAPYLVSCKTDSKSILSVLVRFNGSPEVTPTGNIIYTFPDMQVTANNLGLREKPASLKENDWIFTRVPTERLHWVFFFAGGNLCGAYALNQHLAWFQPLIPYAAQVHFIMGYAIFFMGFPIVRELYNIVQNTIIDVRNRARERSARRLGSAENLVKIGEARRYASALVNVAQQPAFYTTSKDILEQDTDGLAAQFEQFQGQPVENRSSAP